MTTIHLEPAVEAQLEALVADGHYASVADAANRVLAITLGRRQAYRTGGAATRELPPTDEELATEEWRPVPYGTGYEASSFGRIRSSRKVMKPAVINSGHRQVNLTDWPNHKHFLIHRLVAAAFLPNPEGKSDVNHIDGNKANNRASNLEWMSNGDNQRHSVSAGIRRLGATHHKSKLTDDDVLSIRREVRDSTATVPELARRFMISTVQVRNIVQRKSWLHLNDA